MREAAELAESKRGFLEIETGEGVGVGAIGPDAKSIEEGTSHQMRRISGHRADSQIDARFAEINREQLRVGVGHMQDARIAEAIEIIDAGALGAAREPRPSTRERRSAREGDKFPASDGHTMSFAPFGLQRISISFQSVFSLVA